MNRRRSERHDGGLKVQFLRVPFEAALENLKYFYVLVVGYFMKYHTINKVMLKKR
jgi:hypothetical protein